MANTSRKQKLKELLFSSPKFHAGVNVTVRDGDKWMKEIGKDVILKDLDDEAVGFGEIIGGLYTNIGDIPDNILKLEHDKDCTTTRGIWREMQNVYHKTFSFYDKVTVLFFRLQDREEF